MLGVIGLGYVGFTSLIGFSQYSDEIIGYDISRELIHSLRKGKLHIYDREMNNYFSEHYRDLKLTNDFSDLKNCTDIIIAVPTNGHDGGLDLSIVRNVLKSVVDLNSDAVIWIRSTVDDPALFRNLAKAYRNPILFYPEFLREGKCWRDFNNPSLSIVGSDGFVEGNFLLSLIEKNGGEVDFCSPAEAITLKLACNSFHALKVCFANEIDNLCWGSSIDSSAVMRLLAKDRELNISDAYLQPGLPFGGPCLPKDTFALSLATRGTSSLFRSILEVNEQHKMTWAQKLENLPHDTIGIIGLEFKPRTGDYKNSPVVDIIGMIENKRIVVLEREFEHTTILTSVSVVKSESEMFSSVDVVVTYDRSICGESILHWEQL